MSVESMKSSRPAVCVVLGAIGLSLSFAASGQGVAASMNQGRVDRSHEQESHEQESHEQERVINYADLNLSRQSDAAELYSRLRLASKSVCGTYDNRDLHLRQVHAACVEEALSDAVARIDRSVLTGLHQAKSRQRLAQRRVAIGSDG